ncbi:Immunoglobulin subtype [Echinococcus multilocularis]|uniref:Immunoglobulin subtype n=1 Tax=Echinococcus multilocularis TaxID=6211 RepID=A0A068Y7M4_ECHMU|nr:Immunoglobulin subtype [Echinococcus multilocularis]
MLSAFIQTLLWVQGLARDLDFNYSSATEKLTLLALVEGRTALPTVPRNVSQMLRHPRRIAISSTDCVIPSGPHPCLLKPALKNVPTQVVLNEGLHGGEYRVKMEAKEGSIVYLPCNTLHELRNETVIWDHNMSTIAVMGTLFTMDSRFDVASNRFYRCSYPRDLNSSNPPSSRDHFSHLAADQGDVFEAWELVVEGLQMSDSGAYHCRLTGEQPQSLLYQLSVKKSIPQTRVSPKQIVRIDAPRYARRQSSANFTCSMQVTHNESSQVIIDWYRAPSGHRGAGALRVIESQEWNNVSVYKEILGYSKEGLQLDAVMQIHSCDYQHTGLYECQAHRIRQNERSKVYDSLTVEFTVLPRWQYLLWTRILGLCRERITAFPSTHESSHKALSRVVLSDSPTEKQQGQRRSEQKWIQTPYAKNWTLFMETLSTTSAVDSPPRVNVVTAIPPFLCILFAMPKRLW